MLKETFRALRPAVTLTLLLAAITGLAYPALVTGIAQVTMPGSANGSLVRDGDKIVGSELIAQGFGAPRYFHPRPSAAGKGYDASASAATNLAPGSKDLRDAIATRVADARAQGLTGGSVPPDLVNTSASGLDPDLSPEAAFAQALRIATARVIPVSAVRALIDRNTVSPLFGVIGEKHVNVLDLNRQLDLDAPNARQ